MFMYSLMGYEWKRYSALEKSIAELLIWGRLLRGDVCCVYYTLVSSKAARLKKVFRMDTRGESGEGTTQLVNCEWIKNDAVLFVDRSYFF